MKHWLMKSEPDTFGIDHLKQRGTEPWSGVRNYQARNFMRDGMQPGDLAFFYHSSCEVPGVYGIMEIATPAYPDPTQFDRKSPYYDAAATRQQPRWHLVDVKYRRHLRAPVTLAMLKAHAAKLKGFRLLQAGSRLSVMPVAPGHWDVVLSLEPRPAK
ncbi:MAG TPA: EVE domain-containing protein [Candidatus Binatia bacterium]|nr:EVE domain-containing protein [Candidatus Binatia bacterium]